MLVTVSDSNYCTRKAMENVNTLFIARMSKVERSNLIFETIGLLAMAYAYENPEPAKKTRTRSNNSGEVGNVPPGEGVVG